MPVLFPGRDPYHIPRPNFLDWIALALRPAAAGCDNQGLTERMCVPRGASTRLERHARGGRASGSVCLEQWINTHRAGEPVGGALVACAPRITGKAAVAPTTFKIRDEGGA
jgi:hypothetical protein